MNFKEYVDQNKEIQNKLLLFFDQEDKIEENYTSLIELFTNYKIIDNLHELKSLLYLISNISNNHYQTPKFIFKIERVLEFLKSSLKNNFTNQQIFSIFKNSKRILLILIEQKIITFDETILKKISSPKYFRKSYHQFFFPEISGKINTENKETNSDFYQTREFKFFYEKFSKNLPANFFGQRQIGQNEKEISKLIREDLIDEFITYVSKNDYPLNSYIEKSIYETNVFLNKQDQTTLIEYASFFGSTQIFKYLYKNGVELTSSLLIYGIHSDNPEMIQILEENHVATPNKSYEESIKESIKYHHNDITNYITVII